MLDQTIKICKSMQPTAVKAFDWVPNKYGEELVISGTRINLDIMNCAVRTLIKSASSLLKELFYHFPQCPRMDHSIEAVKDSDSRIGDSTDIRRFLQSSSAQDSYDLFLSYLLQTPKLEGKVWNTDPPSGKVQFSVRFMESFTKMAQALLDILLTITHLTSGQPARAPELESLMISSFQSHGRSVYSYFDNIMLVTRYHKMSNSTGFDKTIPRFLPKEVSLLLLKYLIFIRPTLM